MKKLVCLAISAGMVMAVGCGSSSSDPATATFAWGAGTNCPDLGAREAAIIIEGDDSEFSGTEDFVFDCEDGQSPVIDIAEGTWTFAAEAVDLYASAVGSGNPLLCFGGTTNEDCLYYTDAEDTVGQFDTFIEPDFDVDFVPAYAFGAFEVEYDIEGIEGSPAECAVFGPDGADDVSVVATFYAGGGFVEDLFICGDANGTGLTRDLPLDTYALAFDLLDAVTGDPVNDLPTTPDNSPDCIAGECTLGVHLADVLVTLDFLEL